VVGAHLGNANKTEGHRHEGQWNPLYDGNPHGCCQNRATMNLELVKAHVLNFSIHFLSLQLFL
jgi:hypothetical protein